MGSGGKHSQEAMRSIRRISLFAALLFSAYAALVAFGVIPSDHFVGDRIAILGLILLGMALGAYFYVKHTTSRLDVAVRAIVCHVIILTLFVYVTGFWQPFAMLLALLLVVMYLTVGNKGVVLSAAALVLVGGFDILLRYSSQPDVAYQTSLPIIAAIFTAFAMIRLLGLQNTKRKALAHSRERERLQYDRVLTIMNNLTDAAFSTDENGKILMYNAASLDLLDTNDSLRGRYIADVLKLTDGENNAVGLYALLKDSTRATRRDDLNHTYADGESIRLEITFAPIKSSFSVSKRGGEHGGYILIMRDVTKQKSLEEERDEFISVVSHELRTPITIVEGTLSNLDFMMKQPTQPAQKVLADSVSTAHDQVLYLARMVNDLSTLSRAERGVADAAEVIDVKEMLTTLFHRYEKEAEARKLHLNLDIGAKLGKVNVSRLYLEELLQNFVTNAIKYTNEGSVTIIAKRTKDTVSLGVKDSGIGISRSDQEKVFNKFYRSEDYRTRETNGTGLGLYVSAKLAHKLHTQIELKSRLNHGSTFSFELPVE